MSTRIQILGLCLCGWIALAVGAIAHTGATGIVKERMEAMKSIAAAMKGMANADWSDVPAARNRVIENATDLEKHAADIVRLFPADSIHGPSEAIPTIWERPDEFSKIAEELRQATVELVVNAKSAASKEDIQTQFEAIGATCKACHRDFRKKK